MNRFDDEDESPGEYASPPCFMHELDPAYSGLGSGMTPLPCEDVMAWRKAERQRLIAHRLAIDVGTRLAYSNWIARGLGEVVGDPAGRVISAYWPFRGEPDLRAWLEGVQARGGRYALPVVTAKHAPLVFRTWQKGERLARGVWNIPVPIDGEEVLPDVVIAPVVGFDHGCYRLGYGGGFFDRTLATMTKRPLVIGVGYSQAAIPTIHPRWHDIPMDWIITEGAVIPRRG